ncbi:MAG: Serine/threonine-protein kinase PknD [bacterium]|nr:Serine/threonine-protein kinase PknD [bacterium]
MIGKTISHYRILEKLGEGGMGVVYKAEDTKLKRIVALKFLSITTFSGEDKTRFLREAQAAAALNHPNICTIHAIDEVDGQMFIAMEYLEGQNLREKIEAGPLKIAEAIKLATQIAEGLQAAHEKGITHRDIKSANIMITEKGQAKIMDFGLAKLAHGGTLLTKEGMTLGTAAYMSPEQTRGEVVDQRTDIWSLGVVLYEMISGQLPFRGEYEQAIMYAIVHEDPQPLTALRTGVPLALDSIVAKALAKDPTIRYQHVDEIPADLRALDLKPGGTSRVLAATAGAATPSRLAHSRKLYWVMAGLVVAAFIAGATVWQLLRPATSIPKPVVRFSFDLPPGHEFALLAFLQAAISPDGNLLAYTADSADSRLLYLRPLDQLQATALAGTEGAITPFFSPDGKWIGFFAYDKLKKISIHGRTVLTICNATRYYCASWAPDNTIILASQYATGLARVSADGGVPQTFTAFDRTKKEASHILPQVLPNGQSVIFTIENSGKPFSESTIVVQSLTTGERHVLVESGTCGRYVPTGHLLYGRSNSLYAVPFNLNRLAVTGTPVEVLPGVALEQTGGYSHFACSNSGTLIYLPGGEIQNLNELMLVDRSGKPQRMSQKQAPYFRLSLAPDGRHLVVETVGANNDIWLVDMERDTQTRLTFEAENSWPIGTADGKKIILNSDREGQSNLYATPADGSGSIERLTTSEAIQAPTSCAPDNRLLAYDQLNRETGVDIWLLPLEGERKPRPFRQTTFNESGAKFSPDGRWLVYQSDESGRNEVYVQPLSGSSTKWQISAEGGDSPHWSRAGREIVYCNDTKMMAVEVSTAPTFKAGRSQLLFEEKHLPKGGTSWLWDITPDGERFVIIKPGERQRLTRINVVLNWFEELKRKVPTGK